jgi:hypothetical protein
MTRPTGRVTAAAAGTPAAGRTETFDGDVTLELGQPRKPMTALTTSRASAKPVTIDVPTPAAAR